MCCRRPPRRPRPAWGTAPRSPSRRGRSRAADGRAACRRRPGMKNGITRVLEPLRIARDRGVQAGDGRSSPRRRRPRPPCRLRDHYPPGAPAPASGAIGSVGSGTSAGIGVPVGDLAVGQGAGLVAPAGRSIGVELGAGLEHVVHAPERPHALPRSAGRSGSGRSSRRRSGCGCRCRCRRSPGCRPSRGRSSWLSR